MNTTTTLQDLQARELSLEEAGRIAGIERYRRAVEGEATTTLPPGIKALREAVEPTHDAILAALADAEAGKANRSAGYLKFLRMLDPHVLAYLSIQYALNGIGGTKAKCLTMLAQALEDEMHAEAFRDGFSPDGRSLIGLFRYMEARIAKISPSRRVKALNQVRRDQCVADIGWDATTKVRVAEILLNAVISATGLVQTVNTEERQKGKRVTVATLQATEAFATWIESAHDVAEALRPIYPIMICPPTPWTNVGGGGYLSPSLHLELIRGATPAFIGDAHETGMLAPLYEALNLLQETPWAINKQVRDVMSALWAEGGDVAGLPLRNVPALPDKPTLAIGREKEYAEEHPVEWKAWKRERAAIYEMRHDTARINNCIEVVQKLGMATKLGDETLYFPHQVDFRYRMYPTPTVLNPQGDDISKGLLTFATKQALTEDSAVWLAIHGANCWALKDASGVGLDKKDFETRYEWIIENEGWILESAKDPLGCRWWTKADAPWGFLAFCLEWAGWVSAGEGYLCSLPISSDGSCNGLQHYAALMRDEVEGSAVNLVPHDAPADVYAVVAKKLEQQIDEDSAKGNPLAQMMSGKVSRKLVKRPTMTTPYGVRGYGIRDQLAADCPDLFNEFPKEHRFPILDYVTKALEAAIVSEVSSARKGMDYLGALAHAAATSGLPALWYTPDGCPVQQHYVKADEVRVRTILNGGVAVKVDVAHKVRTAMLSALQALECEADVPYGWCSDLVALWTKAPGAAFEISLRMQIDEMLTGEIDEEGVVKVADKVLGVFSSREETVEEEDDDGKIRTSVTLQVPNGKLDTAKQTRAIGPNFIHSLDATHLRMTLRACKAAGIVSFAAIHDSYGVHANDFVQMNQLLREQFVEMHSKPLLADFRGDIERLLPEGHDELPKVPKMGTLDLNLVTQSEYFFA